MIFSVFKEPEKERRVSLLPETVAALIAMKNEVLVETGAGERAYKSDEEYRKAGAEIVSRQEALSRGNIMLMLQPPSETEVSQMKEGTVLLSMLQPLSSHSLIQALARQHITGFSMDTIPRITRAQSMDVLSSMSTIAGYKAVVLAAGRLPRFFPMLMTAAGTIPPTKLLVLGAGVAGLQAIATARRLGAVVEAFDTRPSVREQVESLGAKFVEVEGAHEDRAAGGYAVEQSEEYQRKQKDLIHQHVKKSDVVITTALIPGKRAPILITREMLNDMRPGSVIVDLAAVAGGNCEVTENDQIIEYNAIQIIGDSFLPSTMPDDASRMYGKNMLTFLKLILKDGSLYLNFEDEIVRGTCVTHQGEIVQEAAKKALV